MFLRAVVLFLTLAATGFGAEAAAAASSGGFPLPLESYGDEAIPSAWGKLVHRATAEPLNLLATLIFVAAIVHTFLAGRFRHAAHVCELQFAALEAEEGERDEEQLRTLDRLRFRGTIFHFLGEVEAVFGIWLVPLFLTIASSKGFSAAVQYLDGVNY